MKKGFLSVIVLYFIMPGFSQNCDNLIADLKKGTLHGITPGDNMATIKSKLPCYTGETEEGEEINCGGGVFYLKHHFFCYSGRDYIEMRRKFTGKLSIPVFGLSKEQAIKVLAMGKAVRTVVPEEDEESDGSKREFLFFNTSYGCLVLLFLNGKVDIVSMYNKPAADAVLCL